MKQNDIAQILEAALFAAGEPLNIERLGLMFDGNERPSSKELCDAIAALSEFYGDRGVELVEVASGFRFQSRVDYAPWLRKLWEKKPPRYSRALLETIALVIYRQPITRGEIEDVRGVVVSSNIMKTLLEREWVKIVGHKDVPGKPALYATTKQFLDYFNLKALSDLPPLQELVNFEELEKRLGEQFNLGIDQEAANDQQVPVVDDRDWLAEDEDEVETVEVDAEDEQAAMRMVESIEKSFQDDSLKLVASEVGDAEMSVEPEVTETVEAKEPEEIKETKEPEEIK